MLQQALRHLWGNLLWEPVDLPNNVRVWRLVHVCTRCGTREEV